MRYPIGNDTHDIYELRRRAWYSIAESNLRRQEAARIQKIGRIVFTIILISIVIVSVQLFHATKTMAARDSGKTKTAELVEKLCPSQPKAMTLRTCVSWLLVAQCETGDQSRRITPKSLRSIRWRYNGSSGYDGGLQFSPTTWSSNVGRIPARKLTRYQRAQRNNGRYTYAYNAPPAVQILAAETLRNRPDGGITQWPSCGRRF